MIEVYTQNMYNGDIIMIKSFKNLETMRIYEQHYVKRIPVDVSRIALRKLIMMDNAENINDLRIPPGNRLEKLSGDREGQYSIMIINTPTVGEILKEEFMEPMGISAYKLAQSIFVPTSRVQDILHNRRKISVDTSLRLGKFFGVSDEYFLNLQNDIDLRNAKLQLKDEIAKIKTIRM